MEYAKVVSHVESKKLTRGYIPRTKSNINYILCLLKENGGRYLSIREISDTVRVYESNLQKVMYDLLEAGVVERMRITDSRCKKGPVYGYRLNNKSVEKIMAA